ncbi:hypothetical protein EIP91_007289 [Steccherinum ochraceum]|uniref:Acyl-coenzyme A oxidase n=1 Tax=Steccherinum ochraceum TaxID=92696 RepID=A0A4V2MVE7_9APHY|nr:hypothetical protein EIP91_007289 [Steccherinum ochraceum]
MDSKLYEHPLFTVRHELLSTEDRLRVTYERAKLVVQTYKLTGEDIVNCTKRFWDFQQDPVFAIDPALTNIITCHVNLFIGTLFPLLPGRPDLKPLVEKALQAEIFGNMFLSELGHGLDIQSLETIATKVGDGFILSTPRNSATKFMAPTLPLDGVQRWGIAMSRLVVDGEDRGIHPFLLQTSDEHGMRPGVHNVCLPVRSGSVLDYSLTTFNNVHLPRSAFLGRSTDKPKDPRNLLHSYIWRIPVGTCAIGMPGVLSGKILACIAADYSFRRHVGGPKLEVPIISFRTQALPVLYAVAVSHVFSAWMSQVVEYFISKATTFDARTVLGTIFKTTANRLVTQTARDLGERLGAQGLFPQNHLGIMETDIRGTSISEGDITVVCIRLFAEVLTGRRTLLVPARTDTLLYRRYLGYVDFNTQLLKSLKRGQRDPQFNNLILPQCEPAIRALGHALAYSAAKDAGLPQPLLDLFEVAVIKLDSGWFAEHAGLTEARRVMMEDKAANAALPHLKQYVDDLNIRQWVASPLISDRKWDWWLDEVRRDNAGFAGGLLKRSERLEGMLSRL